MESQLGLKAHTHHLTIKDERHLQYQTKFSCICADRANALAVQLSLCFVSQGYGDRTGRVPNKFSATPGLQSLAMTVSSISMA